MAGQAARPPRSDCGGAGAVNRNAILTSLLAFNGGFVDTVGLLGLHGIFVAHVTGNIVTLAATIALGGHGVLAKALSLPEFMVAVGLTRLAGRLLVKDSLIALRWLFAAQVTMLFLFFLLAVVLDPLAGDNATVLLLAAGCGVAAAAMQNVLQTDYLPQLPPTTFMSGNTMRAVMDATDLACGARPDDRPAMRARLRRSLVAVFFFVAGCAMSAALFHALAFWCLLLPVLVGVTAAAIATIDPFPVAQN